MPDVVLKVLANPGLHRIGLYDNQEQTVVAVSTGVPRHLDIGDEWRVRENEDIVMTSIRPWSWDEDAPTRYTYCLVQV